MTFISDVQIREAVRVVLQQYLQTIADDCVKSIRVEMDQKAHAAAGEAIQAEVRKIVAGVALEYSKQLRTMLQSQGRLQREPVANVVGNWWDPLCKKKPLSVRSRQFLQKHDLKMEEITGEHLARLPGISVPTLRELLNWKKELEECVRRNLAHLLREVKALRAVLKAIEQLELSNKDDDA